MPGESIFSDDWRECLRVHYQSVIRNQDARTERTLRGVMFNVGFSETELNELRVLATMHVDDVDEDFVPDLQVFEAVVAPAAEADTANAAEIEAAEAEIAAVGASHKQSAGLHSPLQDESAIMEIVAEPETELEIELLEDEDAAEAAEVDETPPHDESGPQQLTMF